MSSIFAQRQNCGRKQQNTSNTNSYRAIPRFVVVVFKIKFTSSRRCTISQYRQTIEIIIRINTINKYYAYIQLD